MGKGGYNFYLKKCLLPIAPQKLQIKISNQNKTITLVNEGEVNMLKKAGLTQIEFECCIPQVEYPFAAYKSGFRGARYFLGYFEKLKTSKKPFQFIVSRFLPGGERLFSTNIKVTLEDYTLTEQAGEGFDITVKISLKQWRSYGTKTVNIVTDTPNAAQPETAQAETAQPEATVEQPRSEETSPAPPQNLAYTVQPGDCLWKIAKQFYGNGSLYPVIFEANRDKISNPNLIYAGQILVIPAA